MEKEAKTYYKHGKRVLSRNIIGALLIASIIAVVTGFFTSRPELLYLCFIIMVMALITLIVNNRALNSMVIAAVPLYFIVIPLQPSLYHVFLAALTLFVLFRNGKNSAPWLIIITSVFYLFYGITITNWVFVTCPDHCVYEQILSPVNMVFYFTSVIILAGIIKSITGKWT